jgi:hypothetical protein
MAQCLGICKNGKRCVSLCIGGKCKRHVDLLDSNRCTTICRSGNRCLSKVKTNGRCARHSIGVIDPIIIDTSSDPDEREEDCPICYETLKIGNDKTVVLACNHYYHKICMKRWLRMDKTTCPSCRREVDDFYYEAIMDF